MTDKNRPETPVVLVKGPQKDESYDEFTARVIAQFRAAGLLKSRKPQPEESE